MLLALVFGRKKSRGRWDNLVILLVLGVSLGVGLAACGEEQESSPTPELTEPIINVDEHGDGTATIIGIFPAPEGSPSKAPVICIAIGKKPTESPVPDPAPETSVPPAVIAYNGLAAARWAELNISVAMLDKNNDCSYFVSQALIHKNGGNLKTNWGAFPQDHICKSNFCPFARAYDLYTYLSSPEVGFQAVPIFTNSGGFLRENSNWAVFVAQNIQPGDLVFYRDPSDSNFEWTHVAIVIEERGHTNYVLAKIDDNTNMQEPFIAEHSGPPRRALGQTNPANGLRTIGDTLNKNIDKVGILRKP